MQRVGIGIKQTSNVGQHEMFMGELCPNRKFCDRKWPKLAKYCPKFHQNNCDGLYEASDYKNLISRCQFFIPSAQEYYFMRFLKIELFGADSIL